MLHKRLFIGLLTIAALLLTAVLGLAASAIDSGSAGLPIAAAPATSTPGAPPTAAPQLTPVPSAVPAVESWDPGDGRLNPDPAAPLAIYCGADSTYAYRSGAVEFSFPLSALGPAPQTATLLAEGQTGARLYQLPTGEVQLNLRHDGEEYIFTFNGCPATTSTTRVYDTATGALLAEFTR